MPRYAQRMAHHRVMHFGRCDSERPDQNPPADRSASNVSAGRGPSAGRGEPDSGRPLKTGITGGIPEGGTTRHKAHMSRSGLCR
jgi:hypothetical protein